MVHMRFYIFLSCLILSSCGGGGNDNSSIVQTQSAWKHEGTITGVIGNYTPWIFINDGHIVVFSNTDDGIWQKQIGVIQGVGTASIAISNPIGNDHFIRTSGVVRTNNGCYALLHVGASYGNGYVGGYSPAWATSHDCITWEYKGRVTTPWGQYQSSSANLVVLNSEFLAWEDGNGKGLVQMRSVDGLIWTSNNIDISPAGTTLGFCSAVQTPEGIHLICANGFPALSHIWMFSCDAKHWQILEMAANTKGIKGTNLAFDGITLHAITDGEHYTTKGLGYNC
jgi:hypothetical protein